jgi:hypothetical protein
LHSSYKEGHANGDWDKEEVINRCDGKLPSGEIECLHFASLSISELLYQLTAYFPRAKFQRKRKRREIAVGRLTTIFYA